MLPVFDQPFQLSADASNYGVGSVLEQEKELKWHPIAYFSKHLNKTERNYSTSEKELYAIVLSVEHFRQFLYGTTFTVYTDHAPLQFLLKIKNPSSRLMRWINRLNMFNFSIQYRKGSKHGNADSMSRLTTDPDEDENQQQSEEVIINILISTLTQLNEDQAKDPDLVWLYNLKCKAQRCF